MAIVGIVIVAWIIFVVIPWSYYSIRWHFDNREKPPRIIETPVYVEKVVYKQLQPTEEEELETIQRTLDLQLALVDRLPLDDEEKQIARTNTIREFFRKRR